jgi:hypothetical protein
VQVVPPHPDLASALVLSWPELVEMPELELLLPGPALKVAQLLPKRGPELPFGLAASALPQTVERRAGSNAASGSLKPVHIVERFLFYR